MSEQAPNKAGNEASSITEVLPNFAMEDTRRQLLALRQKVGARSYAGHRCSTLIEQLEKYGRTSDEWQQANLAKGIKEQLDQLAELTAGH